MFFFLPYKNSGNAGPTGLCLLDSADQPCTAWNTLHIYPGRQRLESFDTPAGRLFLLGDPVWEDRNTLVQRIWASGKTGPLDESHLYEHARGHYYWFLLQANGIQIGNSFGAIFPVYYHTGDGAVLVSSSSFYLAEQTHAETLERRNLLERLLFNYPLFGSTWWQGIRLLQAHRHLKVDHTGAREEGRFAISDYFGSGQQSSRQRLNQLTRLFEEEARLFLPDAPFGISYTGGFDGRTLVATALHAGRDNFLTYSFGRPGASDLRFPEAQARARGIPYVPILLDEKYLEGPALESALAFMKLTEYNGNYGRPHYHYAARQLSGMVDYILTGNFGSELFRALHQPGVMMTECLIGVFGAGNEAWKDTLVQTAENWAPGLFRQELDALIADLEDYLNPMKTWEPNHRFYQFVFQEIFRKYFGPELVMQSHYLNNRTPFLTLRFFRELNETIWSGVHSRLFEKMKNKRLKGQMFYAAYLQRTDRQLYRQQTSKGYSPADVLEPWRLPLLFGRVLRQKLIRKEEADSNSVETFLDRHRRALAPQRVGGATHPNDIAALLRQAAGPGDLERKICGYSIAAGWEAAGTVTQFNTTGI
ncbi:MAG: hypothetical protein IPH12_12810 [Saprospirales bacterium]|nr:hypothetical protein [Saprospirales bacterium]